MTRQDEYSLRARAPSKFAPIAALSRLIGACVLIVALMGAATAQDVTSKDITIIAPWARATPGGVSVGGAYLEIKAAPGKGDRLIGASSPVAGMVQIHSHTMEDGVAKMRRVDGIEVKGGSSVVLKPGGYHIMLMDLKQPLKEGDKFKLTLSFERAGNVEVDATVGPIGGKGPTGHSGMDMDMGKAGGKMQH